MDNEILPSSAEGVVCLRDYASFQVRIDGKTVTCALSPQRRRAFFRPHRLADPPSESSRHRLEIPSPVVGDRVQVVRTGPDAALITSVLPRKNRISRRAVGGSGEQVLAANLDQVVAVCALGATKPEWHLLDRFLALAEIEEIPAVVILTKVDLLPLSGPLPEDVGREAAEYRRIGYRVVACSAKTRQEILEVESILRGKTSFFLGKSGAGKLSLANALFPNLGLRVADTGRFGEGHCTTSSTELHFFQPGAFVDAPGLRILIPWSADDVDPALGFREMRPWIGRCRFGVDCRHTEEPGCAIRRAVESGLVSPRRFRSMLRLAEKQQ
ncbi:MAG: ribosome small subunit-dependent GTPase A [Anaerolineales bacterium]|nr:ribosome small subunit-dependent GTPase A [Anaerolineales bacterium]